jgi:hypothetical protein
MFNTSNYNFAPLAHVQVSLMKKTVSVIATESLKDYSIRCIVNSIYIIGGSSCLRQSRLSVILVL